LLECVFIIKPYIITEDLAEQSNVASKTIKRHIAKMPHIRYVGSGYSGHWEITEK
jgi:ATP-dependent DNA helicase RecG